MIYLLDTNTCIYFLKGASPKVINRFRQLPPSSIKLPSVTVAELFYGAEKTSSRSRNWNNVEDFVSTFEIIPFDEKSAVTYARIRTSLGKSGVPIDRMDLLIASISLANNFILVTNNIREFKRVRELKLENRI